jgi:aspartyl-tRNA(Asn)/glutamyl-tRNA(Gln) amidotransferase subunit C
VKIPLAEVRRIADLAHIDLDEAEMPRIAAELSEILTYMESLARPDTEGVEPTFHSLEHPGPFREDAPRPGLGAEEATRGAPGGSPGQFLVPRIVG